MDMHDEQLKNFFGSGRGIYPSQSFREHSLVRILSHHQEKPSLLKNVRREFLEHMKIGFALGLALAAVFIFVTLGGASHWENIIPGNSARANKELLSEAASLDFQIQLGEAAYFTQSASEVALMVRGLKNDTANKGDVDVLLNRIVF